MSAAGLSTLLLRWQASRDQGRPLPAEALCADRPDLAAELHRRIRALESVERRLGLPGDEPTPAIPGYELLEVYDQGGMGLVWKARQLAPDRIVALKMIHTSLGAGQRQRDRFRVEAEAVARLQHPNIVRIYEVGTAEDRPYFTMEFLEGGNLARKLAAGPLSPADAAGLLETLARAVDVAHQHGIIHRDLKPANVLFAADGTPKVADFGLARRLDAPARQTQSGAVLGTPSYMAPEQAAGKGKTVGPAADVYSLGAILYEGLTGRPPFAGDTLLDTLLQVLTAEPVPPRSLQPAVPRDLEAVCLKCLAKAPRQRYASAAALADDLRRFHEGRPVRGRPTPVMRALLWLRRRPLASLLLLVLVLVLGLAATSSLRARAAVRRRAVELAPQAGLILRKYCHECHGRDPATPERQLDVLDHTLLLDGARRLVVPEAPNDSRLVQRIVDESMPPPRAEELPRVGPEELQVLKDWITGGAPPFPRVVDPEPPPVVSELAAQVKQILVEQCYVCHRYDNARGGIKVLNHDLLVAKRRVVVPGRPEESELYRLLTGAAEPVMPPRGQARLSAQDQETVRRWISAGAPAFPRGR